MINEQMEMEDPKLTDAKTEYYRSHANLLKEQKATLSTAESCTGGYIAHLLTTSPGASKYFTGSVVCYDNRIKTSLLQVPEKVLLTEGAVSETTVKQMASAILNLMNTDYSIAVSGIMGPDGGTPEKAVGLVWIAVASKTAIHSKAFNLRYDRSRNIIMTATNALNMLRMLIVDKH